MAQTATLLPTADDANSGADAVFPATTRWSALSSNDGDTSYDGFGSAGTVSVVMADMPSATGVDSVSILLRYKFIGAASDQQTRTYLIISGTKYYSTYVTSQAASYTDITYTWTTNPATGAAWTPAAVNALKAGIQYDTVTGESIRYSYLAITVTYTPTPAALEVTRYLASSDLWLKKRPAQFLTFVGGPELLDLSMLGLVDIEHTAGPHATGTGWEDDVWSRRPFAIHGISIDPNSSQVTLTLKDQRPIMCLVRDLAWSDKASGNLLDGIARFATPGATFTFSRASEHTFTNPVGESETATTDVPAYGDGGLYMLSASGGRAASRYYVTNNSSARTWNAAQGSFVCQVNLAAVSGSANQTVAYCYHDASNYAWVYWDGANARWVFEEKVAGTTARAVKSASPSSATWYQIGARWTGTNLENGGPAYTLSVFVDGVKGTDATAAGVMTQAASSNLDFGSKAAAGTDQLNGQIRKIHSFQYVMTDTEMARAI